MKIAGVVESVGKTAKSYKLSIGGHNYYGNDEKLLLLAGKNVEFDYEMSKPYDFKGKPVQSRNIMLDSLKTVDESTPQIPKSTEHAYTPIETKTTDWTARNRQTDRGMIISYAKDLALAGKIDWLQIPQVVETLFNCQYELKGKEEDIQF